MTRRLRSRQSSLEWRWTASENGTNRERPGNLTGRIVAGAHRSGEGCVRCYQRDGAETKRAEGPTPFQGGYVKELAKRQVQYDGDLDIEIDEDDLKLDGPLLDKLRD